MPNNLELRKVIARGMGLYLLPGRDGIPSFMTQNPKDPIRSGVNAQEKTKKKLLESLRIGAEDILATDVFFDPNTEMATIDVPDPAWA